MAILQKFFWYLKKLNHKLKFIAYWVIFVSINEIYDENYLSKSVHNSTNFMKYGSSETDDSTVRFDNSHYGLP